jgi:hypothetical protein
MRSKNEAELCGRIKRRLKEIYVSVVQTMMRSVQTKLRKIAENRLDGYAKKGFEPHNVLILKK